MRIKEYVGIVRIALNLVLILTLLTIQVVSDPSGATNITIGSTSRYGGENSGGYQVNAYAGNVTQININSTAITQGWQGYYGNVIGTIVLGDNNNKTLYDWNLLSPSGEIYASRANTITWTNINCSNASTMSAEETALNFLTTAKDGINETFSSQSHPSFFVGTKNITANSCYNTNLHNSSGANEATKWYELALKDGTNMVYASLLENNADGFNGSSYDFEMIVAEDGHRGDTSTTPYYFWVELE